MEIQARAKSAREAPSSIAAVSLPSSHGARPWGLQIPSAPAPFLHSLAKVRCVTCAVPSFRSAPEALSWGPARQRPAMLRSSCVLACRRLVLSNRATPLRASRRGVRCSKCYASGAMSRGTRKAAIEPAISTCRTTRSCVFKHACKRGPGGNVAGRTTSPAGWTLAQGDKPGRSVGAGGRQKEDCSPRTRGLASLFTFTSPCAASPSSLWGLS